MAQKIYLDRKWRFNEKFEEAMIDEPMKESRLINIPHTVKETPLSYFDESIYQMESAYQKSIFAPVQWNGKVVILTFEAVGHSCDVYINGKHTKHHDCGYTAFSFRFKPVEKRGNSIQGQVFKSDLSGIYAFFGVHEFNQNTERCLV